MSNGPRIGWRDILEHWTLVAVDLDETFGADLHDVTLVRSWPWWRDRIWGLLGADTRLRRALIPPTDESPVPRHNRTR